MAYTKTNWIDGTTALNQSNMNKIEDALADQDERIDANDDANKTNYFGLSSLNATNISSGDDLNNYDTVGNYRASSNSIAESLTNCPTSAAFRMIVMATDSASYLCQIIISRSATIYLRWGPSDGSNWRAWTRMTTESA